MEKELRRNPLPDTRYPLPVTRKRVSRNVVSLGLERPPASSSKQEAGSRKQEAGMTRYPLRGGAVLVTEE